MLGDVISLDEVRSEGFRSNKKLTKKLNNISIKNAEVISLCNEVGCGYSLKNDKIGHFHIYARSGEFVQYWSGTGTILGYNEKGLDNLRILIS